MVESDFVGGCYEARNAVWMSMSNIVVFGGDSHPELVTKICENLDIHPSKVELGSFLMGKRTLLFANLFVKRMYISSRVVVAR